MQPLRQGDDVFAVEPPERLARLYKGGLAQLHQTPCDRKFGCAATVLRIRLPMAMFVERLQIPSDLIGDAGREEAHIRRWTAQDAVTDKPLLNQDSRMRRLVEELIDIDVAVDLHWTAVMAEIERHVRTDR